MKKLIFLFALLFSTSAFAQNPWVSVNTPWYNAAGTAITALGATDTAYSSSVDFFPYDSVAIVISAIKGDTLGLVVKYQTGDVTTNGASWSAFTICSGNAVADTIGYTTAAADYTGKSFSVSVAYGRTKAPKIRFVIIGSNLAGRLNGVAAEKWLTSAQTKILKKMNP